MVNSGLKRVFLMMNTVPQRVCRPERNSGVKAALTNQTIAFRRHQKLFWPRRFMVY
jgi:hypothetical protein